MPGGGGAVFILSWRSIVFLLSVRCYLEAAPQVQFNPLSQNTANNLVYGCELWPTWHSKDKLQEGQTRTSLMGYRH